MPNAFGNFATACWKGMTCSKSLPSTNQEQQQQRQHDDNAANNSNNNNNDNGGGSNGGGNNGGGSNGGGNNGGGSNGGGNNGGGNNGIGNNDNDDPLIWSNDLQRHSCGEFSYAVVQANNEIRNYSQVEVGSNAIMVGIYDGHVGPHASKFISRNIMTHLIENIRNHNALGEQALENAILAIDDSFLSHVRRARTVLPSLVINGSSCLIAVIWRGKIFIGQVGNSRAVCCRTHSYEDRFLALQMTLEHNVNYFWIRQEFLDSHTDPNLLVRDDRGIWRIKGLTELSRSIGDAYLKRRNFIVDPSFPEFQLSSALTEPVVSAMPFINSRPIQDSDRFFIFATHEFWSLLTNDRAAEIVNTNPRNGIARTLINAALAEACKIADVNFNGLGFIAKGYRTAIHDDMSVVVVFIDHDLLGVKDTNLEQRSFKGFTDEAAESLFRIIDELM